MRANPSGRVVILLEVGVIGYLVGAVAWSLFWPAVAQNYVGMWWGYWRYVGFLMVSLSLVMTGVGCFALAKLCDRAPARIALVTGIANIAAAVPFFIIGLFDLLPIRYWPIRAGMLGVYIRLIGYGLLFAGLLLWGVMLTEYDVVHSGFRRLRSTIYVTSLISSCVLGLWLYVGFSVRFGVYTYIFVSQPYVLAQVLSAVWLHKIGSDLQRKAHDLK